MCFVASVIYYSTAHPEKKINIVPYLGKRIILTYIPSIAVVLVLFFLELGNDSTDNIQQCWRSLYNGSALQYIIYAFAYIVPSAVCIIAILIFLSLYYRAKPRN
jgi:hypothetical protein